MIKLLIFPVQTIVIILSMLLLCTVYMPQYDDWVN